MTLRARLSLTIVFMGILAMIAAISVGELYRNLILENQQHSLSRLVALETETLLNQHSTLVEEMAIRLQKKPPLRQALKNKDLLTLETQMNDEFFQYYVTTGLLEVNKIYIYDKKMKFIVASSEGLDFEMHDHLMCAEHPQMAAKRQGAERVKLDRAICSHMGHGLHSVITPIGTLSPKGYIQILTSPIKQLSKAGKKLGMPIQLVSPTGDAVFQSENWPENVIDKKHNLLTHELRSLEGLPAFKINMIIGNQSLYKDLLQTRLWVIILVGVITSLIVLFIIWLLNRSLLNPLSTLSHHLTDLGKDEAVLGETLQLGGSEEIQVLNNSFNKLSGKLAIARSRLENLAYIDQLTALPNRSRLQELLTYHTSQNKHQQTPFALFIMDLNRFKTVNDTLGHHAGDILLKQVSERLSISLRKTDVITRINDSDMPAIEGQNIARLGGDEFAVVLPTIGSAEDAQLVAQKITNEMIPGFIIEDREFSIGISIGIALCPDHGTHADTLMRKADVAMYQAKNNHQSISVYDEQSDQQQLNTLSLESDLREAIHTDALELYYQPKLNLKHDSITGCEALLRWVHPERGFISPEFFIALAEKTGLMSTLTYWVIDQACKQVSQWHKEDIHLTVAINLSADDLTDTNLLDYMDQCLKKYNLQASDVFLELTETTIMSDPAHALRLLHKLSTKGLKLSIDDFGTGYSSLSYLKQLPVDDIKIDRSFVMDMIKDPNDAIIVKSTIDLAHNMGLTVTAEGVENDPTLIELKRLGCDTIQGFHIARPMTVKEFTQWYSRSHWRH